MTMTHNEFVRIHQVTVAQIARADRLGAEMRKLSAFGNLQVIAKKMIYLIGRDGKIMFQGKRR